MKRIHVHVAVSDLQESIRFYSTLFDGPPSVQKADYARWMLDDPWINFAISARGAHPGLDHLGIQVESDEELKEIAGRLKRAQQPVLEQEKAQCCYAVGNKAWVRDPQGIAWESFHTVGESTVYGEDTNFDRGLSAGCRAPEEAPVSIVKKGCCG